METFSVHGGLAIRAQQVLIPAFMEPFKLACKPFLVSSGTGRASTIGTYAFCAPLFLVWAVATLRKRFSQESAWLGLATIAAISMLPIYHRLHDTRLLLLVFPAFAGVWSREANQVACASVDGRGHRHDRRRSLADSRHSKRPPPRATTGLTSQFLTLMLARPVPLILLAMGVFYLWVYVRHTS